jgi:hypothetical protein
VATVVGERDIERWFADQQAGKARRREVCARKRWFATEAEARAAALWDRTQFGERLACYRCEECDGWHLTGGQARLHK